MGVLQKGSLECLVYPTIPTDHPPVAIAILVTAPENTFAWVGPAKIALLITMGQLEPTVSTNPAHTLEALLLVGGKGMTVTSLVPVANAITVNAAVNRVLAPDLLANHTLAPVLLTVPMATDTITRSGWSMACSVVILSTSPTNTVTMMGIMVLRFALMERLAKLRSAVMSTTYRP